MAETRASPFAAEMLFKTNLPEVLPRELARPAWTGERVAIGTATDPYQPCEGHYFLTRRALEVLRDHRNPLSMVTKSTLILRDRDLLADLARLTEVTVYFTVTTLHPAVWRAVEPRTPPPLKRLRVMQRLVEVGVPCGVFLAPILPGITDARKSIEVVAEVAREHQAATFGTSALRLAPSSTSTTLASLLRPIPTCCPATSGPTRARTRRPTISVRLKGGSCVSARALGSRRTRCGDARCFQDYLPSPRIALRLEQDSSPSRFRLG